VLGDGSWRRLYVTASYVMIAGRLS
jgi:hypothetical protein